jgi:hypothetical protein
MEDLNMKKLYMTPIVNVENAVPTNIICSSFKSDDDTGLSNGGGSDGSSHTKEGDWDIWGAE